jgi:5'-methylthioadenosine phosphorylase
MREEIPPLDLVVPDQIFDRTIYRARSFFGNDAGTEGIVGHITFAEPFSKPLREMLYKAAQQSGATVHKDGTYLCMEGPQFSTRAESTIYRQWGVHIIGMTAMPEARLAREAEIHYATLACATDYDCWHDSHESVTIDMIINNLNQNVARAKATVKAIIPLIADFDQTDYQDECDNALATAFLTDRNRIPAATIEKLGLIVKRYF